VAQFRAGANSYMDCRWAGALRLNQNQDSIDLDQDAADGKKAEVMPLSLRKALGTGAAKYPEVFAMALEIYDSRLPQALADWWSDGDGDDDDDDDVKDF